MHLPSWHFSQQSIVFLGSIQFIFDLNHYERIFFSKKLGGFEINAYLCQLKYLTL